MRTRRSILHTITATGTTAVFAGCSTGNENSGGDSDGKNENTGEDGGGMQLTDIVDITNHEWQGRSILEATVRNKTDRTIGRLQVDVNVYAGDEQISDGYGTISDLPGGIEDTVRVRMGDFSAVPCKDATRYDLVPNFYFENEQYEKRMGYEYDPEFCE